MAAKAGPEVTAASSLWQEDQAGWLKPSAPSPHPPHRDTRCAELQQQQLEVSKSELGKSLPTLCRDTEEEGGSCLSTERMTRIPFVGTDRKWQVFVHVPEDSGRGELSGVSGTPHVNEKPNTLPHEDELRNISMRQGRVLKKVKTHSVKYLCFSAASESARSLSALLVPPADT